MPATRKFRPVRLLQSLHIFGLDHLDPVVLAALADARPLLLVGPHGTAKSELLDGISRCRPETQNKLFSIVHERRVQGLELARLRYRWAAMNPPACTEDGDAMGEEAYLGSLPLDPALADHVAEDPFSHRVLKILQKRGGEGGGFVETEAGSWIGCVLIRVILAWIDFLKEPVRGPRTGPRRSGNLAHHHPMLDPRWGKQGGGSP